MQGSKILLQSDRPNCGTVDNPTHMLVNMVQPLVYTDFTSTFTIEDIQCPIILANIWYDGSGGIVLGSYLDCLLLTFNTRVVVNTYHK